MPKIAPSPIENAETHGNRASLFLRTRDLAKRWGIKEQTIRVWRIKGTGPRYVRLTPTLVAYPLAEVERFEAERTFDSTSAETVARRSVPPGGVP